MSVSPPNRSSGIPLSKTEKKAPGHKGERKSKKDFRLPRKEPKTEEQQKKKNLFDIAGSEEGIKKLKREVETKQTGVEKTSQIQNSKAQESVKGVGQLIQKVVTDMKVGQVGGKNFASLTLSPVDIPKAFAGSHLTLSYEANALTIHFDNFTSPQQENAALALVEQNKEQLNEMVQALQAKNISVQELSLGSHVIALPRVEPLPPPFRPSEPSEARGGEQRGGQKEEQEEGFE